MIRFIPFPIRSLWAKTRFWELVLAAGILVLLGLALMAPLIAEFKTSFPNDHVDFDVVTFIWNQWWTRHALVNLNSNPLITDYVFHPFKIDLRMHTYGLLYGLLAIPFQPLLGTVGAFNLTLCLTYLLNGLATFGLGRRLYGSTAVALILAAMVALNPVSTQNLRVGRPSFASLWPVALALLFFDRLRCHSQTRDALGLGSCLLAALLLDFQIVLFAVLWLAIYAAYCLITNPREIVHLGFLARLGLAAIVISIPFAGSFFPILTRASSLGYLVPRDADTFIYSYQWRHLLNPDVVAPTFGVALPLITLTTLITLLWKPELRGKLVWFLGGLFFLVLSLGVELQPTGLPLPFAGLRDLPGMDHFRTPSRFNITAAFGLALATGPIVKRVLTPFGASRIRALIVSLFLVVILIDSRTWGSFKVVQFPPEPIYDKIRSHPGDFSVLEVPVGIRSGLQIFGRGQTLQYYQIFHQKKGINGMVARVPRMVFQYYRQSPVFQLLSGEEPPTNAEDLTTDFDRILSDLEVGFVIIHPDLLPPNALARIEGLMASLHRLKLWDKTDTIWAYQVIAN